MQVGEGVVISIYGRPVEAMNDHKALETNFGDIKDM